MADLYKKVKLLQGLFTGEKAKTGPFYVTIDMISLISTIVTDGYQHV